MTIIGLSGALGIAISAEKRRVAKVYEQFYSFNERLILNLKFGRERIEKVAEEFDFVKKALNGDKPVKGVAGDYLMDYVAQIGSTDALTQVEYLNEKKTELHSRMQESGDNYKKYGSLYFKLSILAGILIAVLLA